MSASLEPGSWLDSEINIIYYADPVKLEIGLSARNNPVNYVQMGVKWSKGRLLMAPDLKSLFL